MCENLSVNKHIELNWIITKDEPIYLLHVHFKWFDIEKYISTFMMLETKREKVDDISKINQLMQDILGIVNACKSMNYENSIFQKRANVLKTVFGNKF